MDQQQVIEALLRKQGDSSLSELARRIGVSQAFLWQIVNGKASPTGKVLKYLGLKKVKSVKYVKA